MLVCFVWLFIGGISYGLQWSSVELDLCRTFIVVSYRILILINLLLIYGGSVALQFGLLFLYFGGPTCRFKLSRLPLDGFFSR